MATLFHLTHRETWEQAQRDGVYRGDTLDSEGFIHCSLDHQLAGVVNRFYRGQTGLVLLSIAEERVEPEVRYEVSEGDEKFPHIYGPLNLDAVTNVEDFSTGDRG